MVTAPLNTPEEREEEAREEPVEVNPIGSGSEELRHLEVEVPPQMVSQQDPSATVEQAEVYMRQEEEDGMEEGLDMWEVEEEGRVTVALAPVDMPQERSQEEQQVPLAQARSLLTRKEPTVVQDLFESVSLVSCHTPPRRLLPSHLWFRVYCQVLFPP